MKMTPGSKVLMVAGAGMGKSHFSCHTIRLWIKNSTLRDKYQLVLFLPLRFVNNHDGPIEDLLCKKNNYALFPSSAKGQLRRMLRFTPENVLFILDGYDEIPRRHRKNTVINDVIRGKVASGVGVIVTTRPEYEEVLSQMTTWFMYVNLKGMTDKSIDEYISQVYTASSGRRHTEAEMKKIIKVFLPTNLLRVPLLLSFACFLWQTGDNYQLPDVEMASEWDIIGHVIGLFIAINVEKIDVEEFPVYISTIDANIPGECRLILAKIHEMCYDCVMDGEFEFCNDTLKKYDLCDHKILQQFGFFDFYFDAKGRLTAQCIHLLIQEYCAGMHLAQSVQHNQTKGKPFIELENKIMDCSGLSFINTHIMQVIIAAISVNSDLAKRMCSMNMSHPKHMLYQAELLRFHDSFRATTSHYSYKSEAQILQVCKNDDIRKEFVTHLMQVETYQSFSIEKYAFASSSAYTALFHELGPHKSLRLMKSRVFQSIEIEGILGILHAEEKLVISDVLMVGCLPLLHIVGAKEI